MSNDRKSQNRKKISSESQAKVLTESRRRCCICYVLNNDDTEKLGQIAHLDKNPANNAISNLAFLCFEHHDRYDGSTSQSKNYTKQEVIIYRERLYQNNSPASIQSINSENLAGYEMWQNLREKKELYGRAIDEFEDEIGWIREIADGSSSDTRLKEGWYSITPYEHILAEIKSLSEFWSMFGSQYASQILIAKRLQELIQYRFDGDLLNHRHELQKNAQEIIVEVDELLRKIREELS